MKSKLLNAVDDQQELPLARRADAVSVPLSLILKQPNLSGAIALCVQVSGLEEKEVYLTLGVDAGHWTRIMKGDAHFPTNKLNDLCDLCGNEAPLQWWANSRGYALVQIETETQRRLRIAHDQLEEEKKENELLRKLLMGKANANG
jgi:hypothetical protein